MNLQQRIELLTKLGKYLVSNDEDWENAQRNAAQKNPWFTQEFITLSAKNVAHSFLQPALLQQWAESYAVAAENSAPKTIGVVMAGNIPMVGFHDFLCVFISGNILRIKLSSKDDELIKHLVNKMCEWNSEVNTLIFLDEMLKDCDAYIATGSNNSGRYFDYYFAKYPHIIRRNRTSVAVLTGNESEEQLSSLADDVHLYFGLGCRNVTHIFVPESYDFVPFIHAFKKYNYFFELQKYRNNYDYQLALLLMNKVSYMTSGSLLLRESSDIFTPLSVLNYSFYKDISALKELLASRNDLQCIVGEAFQPFGTSQSPKLNDYADGIDTMQFITNL